MHKIKEENWFCVFNPTAGSLNHKKALEEIKSEFERSDIAFEIYTTKRKGDATKVVTNKIVEGYRKFVAIGGDGTVHEVINGFMNQDIIPSEELLFAAIPIGTGNDWAKHHKIPGNITGAINLIKANKTSFQDLGIAEFHVNNIPQKQYFNNVAGMAYDAFVVKKLEQKPRKPNKLIYIFSVLLYLFQYKLQKARLKIDNRSIEGKFYTINVGICKYSGGGMSLVPHAIHNDGLFAVTYAKEISKMTILLNTYRFYNETLIEHKKITGIKAKAIAIQSLDNISIDLELDGELVGHTPVSFEIVPRALRFIS